MEDRHKMKAKKDNIPMIHAYNICIMYILPRDDGKKEKAKHRVMLMVVIDFVFFVGVS